MVELAEMRGHMRHALTTLFTLMVLGLFVWAQDTAPVENTPSGGDPQETAEPDVTPSDEAPAQNVLVLPLSDDGKYMVDQVQADFLLEQLEAAEERGVTRIILKIDTYGGVVFSAREITEALLRTKIPTIAYVETKAISAGAFIAWACDEIVMERHTTMGDAQMIMQTMEGIEVAPEKMVTVFRSDWKKSSHFHDRSFAIAQGFFDAEVEVLQVGTEDDFTFILRDDYNIIPEAERQPILKIICKKDQLLTLFAEEAVDLGIATLAESFESFLSERGITQTDLSAIEMNNNQRIMRFLSANGWIFFVLTLIGLNGIYVEIKAPGFGIPGFTALVCFTIVFGTNYLLGTASALEIAVFILGLSLCAVEIFLLPGLGIAGLGGIICMLGALVMASFPTFDGIPTHDLQWEWLTKLSVNIILTFIGSLISMFLLLPYILRLPGLNKAMSAHDMKSEDGFVMNTTQQYLHLVGSEGVAHGDLKPVGRMELDDGTFLDVISEGVFIDNDTRIVITEIEGNRIIVAPV